MQFPTGIDQRKKVIEFIMFGIARVMSYGIVAVLVLILLFIVRQGIGVISWEFLTKGPTDSMTGGGIFPAIIGTLYLVAGSMAVAIPAGVMAGIYVHEYAKEGAIKRFIALMTNNLAGVPSIIFGLFGMALFVNHLGFGASILAGSLTLGILALPVVIRTTEESLKAIPDTFRQASYGLGASKWYTVRNVVFPAALPNILTGIILAIGRVSGETAPILFTVAAYFLPRLPGSVFDQCMALPYHLYVISTSGTQIEQMRPIAYGTALVLILIVLLVNLAATVLRSYFGKKYKMN
jgi:phosphate transport system permease protein